MTNVTNEPIAPDDVPRDSDERRAWALIHLRRRGMPVRALAEQEQVRPKNVYAAFVTPSARMERVIARALGLKAEQLFPERFAANGARIPVERARRSISG